MSAPERYEDFIKSLKLADRLRHINTQVTCYLQLQFHHSKVRKVQGLSASPITPNVLLDFALENDEVSIEELEMHHREQGQHIAKKKREVKAARKNQDNPEDAKE